MLSSINLLKGKVLLHNVAAKRKQYMSKSHVQYTQSSGPLDTSLFFFLFFSFLFFAVI